MNKIFFARSESDYGSTYETWWIDEIMNVWPNCEILRLPILSEEDKVLKSVCDIERDYFFPLIDESDIVIVAPLWNDKSDGRKRRGSLTLGVFLETWYGIKKGKKVIGIINGDMKKIEMLDIQGYIDKGWLNRGRFATYRMRKKE